MFGKNIILKEIRDGGASLAVHSIFYTIQGEGPYAGWPAVFVRLYGCSLACSWCDTEFESVKEDLLPHELLDRVRVVMSKDKALTVALPGMTDLPLIVITGGEPMRQNLSFFARVACEAGFAVQIETAGIHFPIGLSQVIEQHPVMIVCSPKTRKIHPQVEQYCAVYKYIIDARETMNHRDGLPLLAVSQKGREPSAPLYRPPEGTEATIYVSPLEPNPDDSEHDVKHVANMQHAAWIAMRYGYRLSLQQHKVLNLP